MELYNYITKEIWNYITKEICIYITIEICKERNMVLKKYVIKDLSDYIMK